MEYINGTDRQQIQLLSLEQMIHPQSFVRIVDAFIDMLDLTPFNFKCVRSCRKLEYACQTNIEVMWLLKSLQPKYKTIADFRKDNKKAFRKVFRHFVSILKEWELVEGKTIGIDSFKIRAQNALKNNYNQAKIDRHQKYIDNKMTSKYLPPTPKLKQ